MSYHFKHFIKSEMDAGLHDHHLEANEPSQLSDAFRFGAEWGAEKMKNRANRDITEMIDQAMIDMRNVVPPITRTHCKRIILAALEKNV